MRFPPHFLDEIRARVPVSSVVGRKVQWDRRKSVPGKGDYWACCPFHGEKSPSFHADDRKGRYYCFGCKASGDIFTFLTEAEGVAFPEAVEQLAAEAGLPMPAVSETDRKREEMRASLGDVMAMTAAWYVQQLQTAEGAKARGYLADRGLPVAVQQEFGLGFAPDGRQALKSYLAGKGVSVPQMVEAGLLVSGEGISDPYDRFRNRVMFPIRDARGRVIAFGGRALSPDVPAKYLNSPETPLFHKGSVLYNLDKARGAAHQAGTIIAVEGYMDVIAMSRAGFANTVAPLGTALTADQLGLLWRAAPEPVLCFDGDSAGLKAAYRALDLALPLLEPGQSLRFALLPEGQDPDDLLKSGGAGAVQQVIAAALPMSEVLWQRALTQNDRATPERRAQFERELEQLTSQIGDAKVRQHYRDDVAARLKALWGGDARGGGGARRGAYRPGGGVAAAGGAGRRGGGRFGPPVRPWDMALPASPELRAAAAGGGGLDTGQRRERLIVAAVVNHPVMLDEFAESFAELELSSRDLDRLRREIIDIAALEASLDSDLLRNHLDRKGFGPLLGRMDQQISALGEWFVLPGAAPEDVRTGLRQMVLLHRKGVTLRAALRTAEQTFADEPTEENLRILNEIREELRSTAGEEAAVEGFGEASGRPAGTLA